MNRNSSNTDFLEKKEKGMSPFHLRRTSSRQDQLLRVTRPASVDQIFTLFVLNAASFKNYRFTIYYTNHMVHFLPAMI